MYKFRAVLKEDRKSLKPINIGDYKVNKNNIKFVSSEGKTFKLEDFYYFLIDSDMLKDMLEVGINNTEEELKADE